MMKDAKGRTIRPVLKPLGKGKKALDMEEVYRLLDEGRTVADVAKMMGVGKSTIYQRHQEYQELIVKENGLPL